MLSMQQCIDLCEITPEEAQAIREHATLTEILAIQAECRNANCGAGVAPEASLACSLLNIRDQLIEEVETAGDFDDLARVVHHYCTYALARDLVVADGAEGG